MIAVQQTIASNTATTTANVTAMADGKLTDTDKPWWQGRGYLIYGLFYLIPLFFMGPALAVAALPQWLAIMLALVVFLWVYLRLEDQLQPVSLTNGQLGYQLTGKHVACWSLLVLIAVLVTPLNSGSMTLFGFAGLLLGLCLTGRRLWLGVGMLLGLQALVFWLSFPQEYWFLQLYAAAVVAGLTFGGVMERLRQAISWQQQQAAQEQQTLARQLERERIARDLHDLLGHSLASIAMKAELASVLLAKQQQNACAEQLLGLQQLARSSLAQVRQTISGYQQQGLSAVIQDLLSLLHSKGWSCQLEADIPALAADSPPELELMLTELCTNLLKHSNGRQLQLSACQQDGDWQLLFCDDGLCEALTVGNGLTGIRQRLQALGGDLTVQLAPTCFVLRWPVGCNLAVGASPAGTPLSKPL
jgi:two-component system sensor histidine kinase DesK